MTKRIMDYKPCKEIKDYYEELLYTQELFCKLYSNKNFKKENKKKWFKECVYYRSKLESFHDRILRLISEDLMLQFKIKNLQRKLKTSLNLIACDSEVRLVEDLSSSNTHDLYVILTHLDSPILSLGFYHEITNAGAGGLVDALQHPANIVTRLTLLKRILAMSHLITYPRH
jgi:hypothetical protein